MANNPYEQTMAQYFDLTQALNSETPVYPGDTPPVINQVCSFGTDGFNLYHFSGSMHIGTHIDGPMHMSSDNRMIADFPVDHFCGNGLLIDVRGKKEIVIDTGDRDKVVPGAIVLFFTGWDRYFGSEIYYSEHPALTEETIDFLISRRVKIVGFDSPSPDHYPFPAHPRLFQNNIFIIENLTNLEPLGKFPTFEIMAFPLKLAADSSWTRVVAMVRE